MYLLDTNICIFIKNKRPIHVLERLKAVMGQKLYISSITVAELKFGVHNSQNITQNKLSLVEFLAPFDIIPFDDEDAEQFGIIRAQLKKEGNLIGPYDMLIAAQAVAKSLTLVTNNQAEFLRVKKLNLEDWK